jgi:hypothetical protein
MVRRRKAIVRWYIPDNRFRPEDNPASQLHPLVLPQLMHL